MVKKNLSGSFNLEISNSAQIPSKIFGICQRFFLKSVRGMFIWFSERQIKACSALLLLDGEIRSSPQHVIIHDLAIPDERQGHYLHSVL